MAKTVVVTGGTGNLGRHVVRHLSTTGNLVRVASRGAEPHAGESVSARQPSHDPEVQWAVVDYRTRAGLDAALADADIVIHCASGSASGEAETMAALLSSGKRAGLAHLLYISIVGIDKLPMRYYKAKVAAERALIASGLPWTILRTTQFHDLALALVKGMCRLPVGIVPKGVSCQSVDVDEVAGRLAELADGPPAGRVPEFGGPEIKPFTELARLYLSSAHQRKKVVPVPLPGKLMKALIAGYGLTPEHGDGVMTFTDFLRLGPHQ